MILEEAWVIELRIQECMGCPHVSSGSMQCWGCRMELIRK